MNTQLWTLDKHDTARVYANVYGVEYPRSGSADEHLGSLLNAALDEIERLRPTCPTCKAPALRINYDLPDIKGQFIVCKSCRTYAAVGPCQWDAAKTSPIRALDEALGNEVQGG